jgi:transposase
MVKSEGIMAEVKRRRSTEEFKREAMRSVRESAHPVAQVARDLGIPDTVLYC